MNGTYITITRHFREPEIYHFSSDPRIIFTIVPIIFVIIILSAQIVRIRIPSNYLNTRSIQQVAVNRPHTLSIQSEFSSIHIKIDHYTHMFSEDKKNVYPSLIKKHYLSHKILPQSLPAIKQPFVLPSANESKASAREKSPGNSNVLHPSRAPRCFLFPVPNVKIEDQNKKRGVVPVIFLSENIWFRTERRPRLESDELHACARWHESRIKTLRNGPWAAAPAAARLSSCCSHGWAVKRQTDVASIFLFFFFFF